jgi:hypothetical protein
MDTNQKIQLGGEIVETIERDGRHLIKIQLRRCAIEVDATALKESHLGDSVLIDADITIRTVRPTDVP